jgi:hypothetical protein
MEKFQNNFLSFVGFAFVPWSYKTSYRHLDLDLGSFVLLYFGQPKHAKWADNAKGMDISEEMHDYGNFPQKVHHRNLQKILKFPLT